MFYLCNSLLGSGSSLLSSSRLLDSRGLLGGGSLLNIHKLRLDPCFTSECSHTYHFTLATLALLTVFGLSSFLTAVVFFSGLPSLTLPLGPKKLISSIYRKSKISLPTASPKLTLGKSKNALISTRCQELANE